MTDEPDFFVEKKPENPYRRPFQLVAIFFGISLLFQACNALQVSSVTTDTNRIVRDIDERNSPEMQKAEAAYLEQIILRVDCNARLAIEEALNDINDQNPAFAFDVDITGPCTATSTTTTVPGG